MDTKYQKWEIIYFKKIHYNIFFKYIENKNAFANELLNQHNNDWILKMRPAIIWKVYDHESGLLKSTRYLIIPLTTKNSADHWINYSDSLRIKLDNKGLKGGFSYLMLDSIMPVTHNDIEGFYNNKEIRVKLTGGQKRYIKEKLKCRSSSLFSIPYECLEIPAAE